MCFAVLYYVNRVRIKLIAPFNGTDGSGLGRCYAYVGMRDTPANSLGIPARWQEAGAYGTNCTPIDEGSVPLTGQVRCCVVGGLHSGSSCCQEVHAWTAKHDR